MAGIVHGILKLKLQPRYFNLLIEGRKVVEGRLYKPKFDLLHAGESIHFINDSDHSQSTVASLISFHRYNSFHDMLINEGLEKCLPGVSTIQKGVELYYTFPNYRELERRVGVIALRIKIINDDYC